MTESPALMELLIIPVMRGIHEHAILNGIAYITVGSPDALRAGCASKIERLRGMAQGRRMFGNAEVATYPVEVQDCTLTVLPNSVVLIIGSCYPVWLYNGHYSVEEVSKIYWCNVCRISRSSRTAQ